jgi:hypothetical protein
MTPADPSVRTAPATAAGRDLLDSVQPADWFAEDANLAYVTEEMILAIEAEAAQPLPGLDVPTLIGALDALGFQSLETDRDRYIFTEHAAQKIAAEYARLRGGDRG